MAAQTNGAWQEQWFKTKYGRNTPMEEARQAAARKATPGPEATAKSSSRTSSWMEQWFKAKFGRHTPAEEARLALEKAEQPATQDLKPAAPISWSEQWFKAKFGRYSPREEARQNAARK